MDGTAGKNRERTSTTDEPTTTSGDVDSISKYEWAGGIIAGLGIFLTPLLTTVPAVYCAYKIREEKPVSSLLILAAVLATIVFWWVVVAVILP